METGAPPTCPAFPLEAHPNARYFNQTPSKCHNWAPADLRIIGFIGVRIARIESLNLLPGHQSEPRPVCSPVLSLLLRNDSHTETEYPVQNDKKMRVGAEHGTKEFTFSQYVETNSRTYSRQFEEG